MQIERRPPDPGPAHDVVDGHRDVSTLGERLQCGGHDVVAGHGTMPVTHGEFWCGGSHVRITPSN